VIEIRRYVSVTGRDIFGEWFSRLTDLKARARVAIRIDRLAAGNFGDTKALGGGLHELRIDWGPGYRVYYGMIGKPACCFFAAETSASSRRILRKHESS
jgi:putative addiction module killer protein